MGMNEYTEEADRAITAARRPVEPGDLVTHEDDIGGILGRVFSVDDTQAQVSWSHSSPCVTVSKDRLHFLERPEFYACVSFQGTDEISGEDISYCFVSTGTAEEIQRDLTVYGPNSSYTVSSSRH